MIEVNVRHDRNGRAVNDRRETRGIGRVLDRDAHDLAADLTKAKDSLDQLKTKVADGGKSLVKNLFKVGGDEPPAIQVFEPEQPIPTDVPLPPRRSVSHDSPLRMAALPAAASAKPAPAAADDGATQ